MAARAKLGYWDNGCEEGIHVDMCDATVNGHERGGWGVNADKGGF
jgi:hypothetical protein